MRANPQFLALVFATGLLTAYLPAYAESHGHGNDDDNSPAKTSHDQGPPATPPGHSGDHGGTSVKPPQGSCSDDTSGIDVQGPDGQSGASHVAHTDFVKIDSATGDTVASASSASMMYFWFGSTFDYVLNAHQLTAGSQWTLTYQPEPMPSAGVVCLGHGTVNGGGQLHIATSIELNSNLPPGLDPTADPATQPPDALLALVTSSNVDCTAGTMTTFTPDNYLFSKPRVRFVDTDLLPPATP